MKNRKDRQRLAIVAATALLVGGAVFAQSPSLTAPNNSAGTPNEAPARTMTAPAAGMPSRTESADTAFDKLDTSHRGYITRSDVNRLPGTLNFDEADRNHDGRLDSNEFQRAWNDYGAGGQ
jgi:hypothetical protein